MMRWRGAVVSAAGLLLGGLFLWLAVRAVDLDLVLDIAMRAGLVDILAVIGCALAFAFVKALRWKWLMSHLRSISTLRLVGPVFVGTTVNYGVPHAGELVRAWMLARREALPKAAVLASIAVERLFDFCATLVLGLLALLAGRAMFDAFGVYLWVLAGLIAVALTGALPFVLRPTAALRLLRTLLRPLPTPVSDRIMVHVEHGVDGLGSLQQGTTLVQVVAISILQWALMAGCVWFSLRAAGVAPDPSLSVVILLLLVVGLTLPAAPGHVGTTQVAFLLAGAPFGIGNEQILAGSFVYNVFVPLTFIVVGVATLVRRGHAPGEAA